MAQLTSEKAVAEAYAGELKTALEEAYEYIEQLEEDRWESSKDSRQCVFPFVGNVRLLLQYTE